MKKTIFILVNIAILLFITSFLFGIKALNLSNDILLEIKNKQLKLLEYIVDLDNELKKNQIQISEAIILNDIDSIKSVHDSFYSLKQKVENLNKLVSSYEDKELNEIIKNIQARLIGYQSIEISIVTAISSNNTIDKQDALIGFDSVTNVFSQDMKKLRKLTTSSLTNQIYSLEESNKATVLIIFFVLLFGVLIILFTIIKLYKLNQLFEIELTRANETEKLAKIGSWKYDIKKNILTWSDEAYDILEQNKKLNTIKDFLKQVFHEDKKDVISAYNIHLLTQEPYQIVHRLMLNNEIKFVEIRCETTFDSNGSALISNGTIQDITIQKQKDHQLLQQSRLAQMGEMISMIAHQWRQPLGAISSTSIDLKMQSELEMFDLSKKEEAKKYETYVNTSLNTIDELIFNLTTTIDDFRNFYKPNKKSEFIKMHDVIKRSLNIINSSIVANDIDLIKEYNSNSKIKMYSNEMMQVVLNILKNSLDNFKDYRVEDPYIKIRTYEEENIHFLKISDNGGGIGENIINKIFDPYFSTKHDKNGTGLGLYMSKTIIEEHHNGKLYVENTDNGVCFTIELKIL